MNNTLNPAPSGQKYRQAREPGAATTPPSTWPKLAGVSQATVSRAFNPCLEDEPMLRASGFWTPPAP